MEIVRVAEPVPPPVKGTLPGEMDAVRPGSQEMERFTVSANPLRLPRLIAEVPAKPPLVKVIAAGLASREKPGPGIVTDTIVKLVFGPLVPVTNTE